MAKKTGGPKTAVGKRSSSQNSTTHSMCARQLLVKGERQEDFDALEAEWLSDYDAGQAGTAAIQEAVLNDWLLRRVQRAYLAKEARTWDSEPSEWTAEQWHELSLAQRYKGAAERSFHRSWAALERFRRVRVTEGQAERRLKIAEEQAVIQQAAAKKVSKRNEREQAEREAECQAEEERKAGRAETLRVLEILRKPPTNPTITQYVNVTEEDGRLVTRTTPSNEAMVMEREKRALKPITVARQLHMGQVEWLPPEYEWVERLDGETVNRRQEMSWERWLKAVEDEKAIPGGHLGPVDDRWEEEVREEDEWEEEELEE